MRPSRWNAADPVEASGLEGLVADGEDLVDQHDLGVDVHRAREAEAHEHARRVELHPVSMKSSSSANATMSS